MADLLGDLLDGAEPITWAEERIALCGRWPSFQARVNGFPTETAAPIQGRVGF